MSEIPNLCEVVIILDEKTKVQRDEVTCPRFTVLDCDAIPDYITPRPGISKIIQPKNQKKRLKVDYRDIFSSYFLVSLDGPGAAKTV